MHLDDLLRSVHDDPTADPTDLRLVAPDERANRARRRDLTRRTFVLGTGLGLGAAAAPLTTPSASAAPKNHASPFTLGIASGDPTPTGIVLWTRLALDPLAEDGVGAMGSKKVMVHWQISEDPQMHRVVRAGTEAALPQFGFAVHAEVEGLRPGREYYFRFRTGRHESRIGRTRTLPAAESRESLRAIAVSCSHWEGGHFTAYHHAAQERPDVVLALGDYIYEGKEGTSTIRRHVGGTCLTLADYRRRYAQYKTDPNLQELHAAAPWIVSWDDHEIQDNWAGLFPKDGVPSDAWTARKAAGMRAFWENMPLRRSRIPHDTSLPLHRRFRWGRVADLHVLDTRQFRDLQACHNGGKNWWFTDCAAMADPSRTILGAEQKRWLIDGFDRTEAAWQVLQQGVFFARRDSKVGPGETLSSDAWDGYSADRDAMRDAWAARGLDATVLTGDVHVHFANEIKADFRDVSSPTVGTELVTSSITSGGDGSEEAGGQANVLKENPHIKFINNRRGYVSVDWHMDRMDARYMTVPFVEKVGAPIEVKRAFSVPRGQQGLHPMG